MLNLADELYDVLLKLLQNNSERSLSLYEHRAFITVIDVLKRIGGK